jgi:membrane protein insertase Oxa1/YidC/SpoIIIJ
MKELDPNVLMQVIGGASTVSQKKLDAATESALTKLNSDLKDLAKPQQNQTQQMMLPMMMAMMMRR